MTIMEIMIGIVIGMFVVIVIYQVYGVAERFKRNTTTSGDAQTTGLFSMYFVSREISNAGAGIAIRSSDQIDLFACPNVALNSLLRPIPVMITDSGADDTPDSLIVYYGAPNTLATGAPFTSAAGIGTATYQVQSPLGFAAGDVVVAVRSAGNVCEGARITAITPPALGIVSITHTNPLVSDMPQGSKLFNLGPLGRANKVLFDVDPATNVLRTTDLFAAQFGAGPAAPNPIASNIVNFKAQYGIDTSGTPDNTIDAWVPATAASIWDPVNLAAAPAARIQQIKAIRIGIIVRGDEADPDLSAAKNPAGWPWTMFACPPFPAPCPGPQVTGNIPGGATFGYRYRIYETVIPLRNAIWNGT